VDRATDLEMDPEVTPVETKAVRRKRRLAMAVPRHQSFGKREVIVKRQTQLSRDESRFLRISRNVVIFLERCLVICLTHRKIGGF
jgi:hypothetical protein